MDRILLLTMLLMMINTASAEMYKWVDDSGQTHFSDKKPANEQTTDVVLNPGNIIEGSDDNSEDLSTPYVKDRFRMPYSSSKVPYRFIMTSAMNAQEPTDRLSSIDITTSQKSFHSYIKLLGVEANVNYNLRIRVIDAKGELVFDKDKLLKTQSNSIWFVARVSPEIYIDEPGDWTIQAILNNEKLFVEKKRILF